MKITERQRHLFFYVLLGLAPIIILLFVPRVAELLGLSRVLGGSASVTQPNQKAADASNLIIACITIYLAFIAVFGTLAPTLGGRHLELWKLRLGLAQWWALVFIIGAIAVDVWRLLSSISDLYEIVAKGLTNQGVHNEIVEFKLYFLWNAVILAFVLGVYILIRYARDASASRSESQTESARCKKPVLTADNTLPEQGGSEPKK